MSQKENQSEVRRLMEQIDRETEAINRVFTEPAIVANHAAIQAKYASLGKARDELAEHVGDEEATKIAYDSYEKNVG